MINAFIGQHQEAGWCGRTVNLSVTVLRNVLKRAVEEGYLKVLPTAGLKPLRWTPRKRELVTREQLASRQR